MDLGDLLTLQGTLFLLMLLGAYLTKKGVITKEGKRCLTDLVVYVILPCTIFKSCFVDTGTNFAAVGALLLLLSLVIEVGSLFFNQVLYRRYSGEKRKVLQYGTLVPNSGFLGTPIAEGVYHDLGVFWNKLFHGPGRHEQKGVMPKGYYPSLPHCCFSEPCCHDFENQPAKRP